MDLYYKCHDKRFSVTDVTDSKYNFAICLAYDNVVVSTLFEIVPHILIKCRL